MNDFADALLLVTASVIVQFQRWTLDTSMPIIASHL